MSNKKPERKKDPIKKGQFDLSKFKKENGLGQTVKDKELTYSSTWDYYKISLHFTKH